MSEEYDPFGDLQSGSDSSVPQEDPFRLVDPTPQVPSRISHALRPMQGFEGAPAMTPRPPNVNFTPRINPPLPMQDPFANRADSLVASEVQNERSDDAVNNELSPPTKPHRLDLFLDDLMKRNRFFDPPFPPFPPRDLSERIKNNEILEHPTVQQPLDRYGRPTHNPWDFYFDTDRQPLISETRPRMEHNI